MKRNNYPNQVYVKDYIRITANAFLRKHYSHCRIATVSVAVCLPALTDLAVYNQITQLLFLAACPHIGMSMKWLPSGAPRYGMALSWTQNYSCFKTWTQRPPPFALTTSMPRKRCLAYRQWSCYISCLRSEIFLWQLQPRQHLVKNCSQTNVGTKPFNTWDVFTTMHITVSLEKLLSDPGSEVSAFHRFKWPQPFTPEAQ